MSYLGVAYQIEAALYFMDDKVDQLVLQGELAVLDTGDMIFCISNELCVASNDSESRWGA